MLLIYNITDKRSKKEKKSDVDLDEEKANFWKIMVSSFFFFY